MRFGQEIKKARVAKGITQVELARMIGYEQGQFISLLERDQSKVPLETLGKLCRILELDPDYFIEEILKRYRLTATKQIYKGYVI